MRKYFIVVGFQRKGPFTIEELIKNNITKETLIWSFELGDNTPAGEIPELASLFGDVEPIQDTEGDVIPIKPTDKINNNSSALSDEELLKIFEASKKEIDDDDAKKQVIIIEQNKKTYKKLKENKITEIVEGLKQDKTKEQTKDNLEINATPLVNEQNFEEISEPEKELDLKKEEYTEKLPLQYEPENESSYQKTQTNFSKSVPKRPKNYLLASILATIFCCLPFGIIGIINASQVDSKYKKADYAGAEKSSKNAKTILILSVILGIVLYVIIFWNN